MFTDYAYYDFFIIDLELKESRFMGTPYIQVEWESKEGWVFDTIPYPVLSRSLSGKKWKWYNFPIGLDSFGIDEVKHVIGRKERLKVIPEIFRNKKFYRVEIPV